MGGGASGTRVHGSPVRPVGRRAHLAVRQRRPLLSLVQPPLFVGDKHAAGAQHRRCGDARNLRVAGGQPKRGARVCWPSSTSHAAPSTCSTPADLPRHANSCAPRALPKFQRCAPHEAQGPPPGSAGSWPLCPGTPGSWTPAAGVGGATGGAHTTCAATAPAMMPSAAAMEPSSCRELTMRGATHHDSVSAAPPPPA